MFVNVYDIFELHQPQQSSWQLQDTCYPQTNNTYSLFKKHTIVYEPYFFLPKTWHFPLKGHLIIFSCTRLSYLLFHHWHLTSIEIKGSLFRCRITLIEDKAQALLANKSWYSGIRFLTIFWMWCLQIQKVVCIHNLRLTIIAYQQKDTWYIIIPQEYCLKTQGDREFRHSSSPSQ